MPQPARTGDAVEILLELGGPGLVLLAVMDATGQMSSTSFRTAITILGGRNGSYADLASDHQVAVITSAIQRIGAKELFRTTTRCLQDRPEQCRELHLWMRRRLPAMSRHEWVRRRVESWWLECAPPMPTRQQRQRRQRRHQAHWLRHLWQGWVAWIKSHLGLS